MVGEVERSKRANRSVKKRGCVSESQKVSARKLNKDKRTLVEQIDKKFKEEVLTSGYNLIMWDSSLEGLSSLRTRDFNEVHFTCFKSFDRSLGMSELIIFKTLRLEAILKS